MKNLVLATAITMALASTNVLAQERIGGSDAGSSAKGGVDENVVFALASTAVLFGAVAANSNGFSPIRGVEPPAPPPPQPPPATCNGDDQLVDGVCIGTTVTSTITDTITGTGTATATATINVTSLVTFTYAPTN